MVVTASKNLFGIQTLVSGCAARPFPGGSGQVDTGHYVYGKKKPDQNYSAGWRCVVGAGRRRSRRWRRWW